MPDDEKTIDPTPDDAAQEAPVAQEPAPEGRWVSTEEAAALLGVATRTVRRRIDAGALKGERVEGSHAYRVWIEGAEAAGDGAGEPTEEPAEADAGATGQGSDAQLPAVPGDAISWVLADHLTELTRANAALATRIEQLATEAATYKERVRILEEQAKALPAGEVPTWRPWWKRIFGLE